MLSLVLTLACLPVLTAQQIRATAPGLAEVLDRIDSIRLELNEACNFQSKKTQVAMLLLSPSRAVIIFYLLGR